MKGDFNTKLTELGLSETTVNFLNKLGLITIRDVMEEGKEYLINNSIKKNNLKELINRFREIGIICKDEGDFVYIGNLEDGVTGFDYLENQNLF